MYAIKKPVPSAGAGREALSSALYSLSPPVKMSAYETALCKLPHQVL